MQETERLLPLLQLLAPPNEGPVPTVLVIVENGANSIGDLLIGNVKIEPKLRSFIGFVTPTWTLRHLTDSSSSSLAGAAAANATHAARIQKIFMVVRSSDERRMTNAM